jgi:hypothetical protein
MCVLDEFGLPGNLIMILKNMYMKTCFTIDGKKFILSKKGLLQGSSLSPLLFNIYIDGLLKSLQSAGCLVRAFADDVVLVLENWIVLNSKLEIVEKWSDEFGISINSEKSGIIRLLKRTGKILGAQNYLGIQEVKEYKYLGVWLDQSNSFKRQINYVKSKCHLLWKEVGSFYNPTLNFKTRRRLLKSVVFQILNFGADILCKFSIKYSTFMSSIKYKFTKRCFGIRGNPKKKLLFDLVEGGLDF